MTESVGPNGFKERDNFDWLVTKSGLIIQCVYFLEIETRILNLEKAKLRSRVAHELPAGTGDNLIYLIIIIIIYI